MFMNSCVFRSWLTGFYWRGVVLSDTSQDLHNCLSCYFCQMGVMSVIPT